MTTESLKRANEITKKLEGLGEDKKLLQRQDCEPDFKMKWRNSEQWSSIEVSPALKQTMHTLAVADIDQQINALEVELEAL